jgi:hypothetical protein
MESEDVMVGPGMSTFCLEENLNQIANFAALDFCKAKAWLELLHSRSSKQFTNLTSAQFDFLAENGNIWLGFIPEEVLKNMFGNRVQAKWMIAIQVQVFSPKFGVFKGVFFRKHNIHCPQCRK